MRRQQRKNGGFSYSVTKEQIDAYLRLPAEERLRWLEEGREFILRILPEDKLEIMGKFRRGEM